MPERRPEETLQLRSTETSVSLLLELLLSSFCPGFGKNSRILTHEQTAQNILQTLLPLFTILRYCTLSSAFCFLVLISVFSAIFSSLGACVKQVKQWWTWLRAWGQPSLLCHVGQDNIGNKCANELRTVQEYSKRQHIPLSATHTLSSDSNSKPQGGRAYWIYQLNHWCHWSKEPIPVLLLC